jgi:hypothetical protein|tara:strand:+ start:554 stop:766 length:213 start_codon:yes stop_codon:yes gene_type:complete
MSKNKWHGWQQKKANIKHKKWLENLSDEDRTRMNIPRTRTQGELVFKKKADPFIDFALENLMKHLNTKNK